MSLLDHATDVPSPAHASSMASDERLIARAEERAAGFLAAAHPTRAEASRARRLARLLADDEGRDLLLDLTDQVMRIHEPARSAARLGELARDGVPCSLGGFDRVGLGLLGRVAPLAPTLAQSAVGWRVDRDTAGVILPADDPAFARYLARRTAEGFHLNVNVLGEAILGDDEANERCRRVLELIERPDVDYVSVKISAICANLDVFAWDDSMARIETQLVRLYRAARDSRPRTFVNLDMEEYRDLELSVESFMRVLDKPEFQTLPAGIVLQAYIPDSHAALRRLCHWANARRERGGAPIKIRLVKGANLANELVEADLHDWPLATYGSKAEVDASFKAMLDHALSLGSADAVRIGVASHNLFEVAWALTVRDALEDPSRLEIEMLEGMAPPQARAVRDAAGGLLLYAPVVAKADRDASIAYLSRRLDENASPENFLYALFDIAPGSPSWVDQAARFEGAVRTRHVVPTRPRRSQDRATEHITHPVDGSFRNEPDTDFTVAANRAWAAAHLREAVVPDAAVLDSRTAIDALVADARRAQARWSQTSWADRRRVLAGIADVMSAERGRTLAVMAHTVGKTVREGDPEISEAIDFATYAAHLTLAHERLELAGSAWQSHGAVVVAGPWNFPYAIPASGLVHAIAAGSAVILKPAPQARAVAALLVDQINAAGVPAGLVQLACTPDDETGQHLISHPDVDLVMLTGSYETAALFASWNPERALLGETSGKNAIVVTAAADVDQAIKDIVRSAFGHAGQKCSAASLAIVEASVHDDPSFLTRLADAVRSLTVGPSLDPATMVGPLIEEPSPRLLRALTRLDSGETWLVEPRRIPGRQELWTPGVRAGVVAGSWFHQTECFGPVLGVMRAPDLDTAIDWQNGVEYGLTGGLESLDPQEIEHWLARVQVGNAYVNRHITGAIVQRQPFGGWKRSSIGPGAKPGGPGHLHSYGTWSSSAEVDEAAFAASWSQYFLTEHDPAALACEANILRYRPLDRVIVRVEAVDDPQVPVILAASRVTGVPVVILPAQRYSDAEVVQHLATPQGPTRLRLLCPAGADLLTAAFDAGVAVDAAPAVAEPMIELRRWVIEQAISRTMHRHGRLLRRTRP